MTRPKYKGKRFQLFLGKCENILKELPSNSVHSIVCDPPYELGFMGKSWDASGIAYNTRMWKDAMRVLKPGGYLLAFSGSRTYHRMVCAIEDAGFEIRDQIMWLYGSGFPKSQNVSKAIDKAAGAERKVVGVKPGHENFVGRDSIKSLRKDGALSSDGGFSRPWMHDKEAVDKYHMLTAPATDDAKEWEGWGTALKPSHEPICVARKPFKGTVIKNVLKHRTGAVNIDACRVGTGGQPKWASPRGMGSERSFADDAWTQAQGRPYAEATKSTVGRFPANVIHDGSDDVSEAFAKFGESKSRKGKPRGSAKPGEGWGMTKTGAEYNDEGSPARFFCQINIEDSEWLEQELSLNPALFVENSLSLKSLFDGIAQKIVAIGVLPEDKQLNVLKAPSMSVTLRQSKKIAMLVMQTMLNFVPKFLHAQQLERLSLIQNHVKLVAQKEQTGITTITANLSKSDGSVVTVIFSITQMNLEVGERACEQSQAARFNYCAKASKKDREEGCSTNQHPTVKPTELMRYLVRLVTPPNGIVLDPFMGSGSTGKACMLEGFKFAGIDMYPEYVELSHARITHALTKEKK